MRKYNQKITNGGLRWTKDKSELSKKRDFFKKNTKFF